ncbi:hypothetical protein KGQ20_39500 [Catenulispora sp. NF23]|uniref:hypothetical protein n=1 Tax=Catenulispora pinistramenti TaxID=2705254 RepID=UPI001BAB0DCC|nr:hypothetical protein [Catenulispora pinistramenti]MBS2538850.1 hypothetical protein [Catenulispora pinistramenti]
MTLPEGRFFNQETDDLHTDFPYLAPLDDIPGLPAPSVTYREYARGLDAIASGTPLAETGRKQVAR